MDLIDYILIGVSSVLILLGIAMAFMESTRLVGIGILVFGMISTGFTVWWVLKEKKPVTTPGDEIEEPEGCECGDFDSWVYKGKGKEPADRCRVWEGASQTKPWCYISDKSYSGKCSTAVTGSENARWRYC